MNCSFPEERPPLQLGYLQRDILTREPQMLSPAANRQAELIINSPRLRLSWIYLPLF